MRVLYFLAVLSCLLIGAYAFFGNKYCKIASYHVMCDEGFDSRCGRRDQQIYSHITDKEREEALRLTNDYRNQLAQGIVSANTKMGTFPYPSAANMEEIVWDMELERIAHAVVKKCYDNHYCKLVVKKGNPWDCYQSVRGYTSENLFTENGPMSVDDLWDKVTYTRAFSFFMAEKDYYHPDDIKSSSDAVNRLGFTYEKYGHFVTLMASRSKRLGCAKMGFPYKKGLNMVITSCLYWPGGTFTGQPIYISGSPCTKCEDGPRSCSKKYPSLCAAEGRKNDPDVSSRGWLSKALLLVCLTVLLLIYF